MPDLPPEILPSVWSLIRSLLAARPLIDRKEAIELLTPRGLIQRTEAGEATSDSRHVRPSLQALIDIGAVRVTAQDKLSLADGIHDEDSFRAAVADTYLAIPGNEAVDLSPAGGGKVKHEAQIATAWLQLQGIGSPMTGWQSASQILGRQLGGDRALLRSDVPYNSFERLARWCGVAAKVTVMTDTGLSDGLIPDPTDALRRRLDTVLPPGTEESARSVIDRATALFPWLPTGAIGRAVAEYMTGVPDAAAEDGTVPQSLSLALVQLHLDGTLKLIPGDDVTARVTLTPPGIELSESEGRAFARVRRTGEPR